MKQASLFGKTRTIVSLASAILLFSAGPLVAQVSAPGNDRDLPSSAQKAPPFQGGGGGTFNPLLEGDYIYSGPATCLFSSLGFSNNFQPIYFQPPNTYGNVFVQTYMVNGKATFDGNGNGTLNANSLAVNPGGIGGGTFHIDFTYQLNPYLTITLQDLDSIATNPQGQQSSVTGPAQLQGRVSADMRTIKVMHYAPSVETITNLATGAKTYRVCTRERTFTRIGAQ